MPDQTTGYTELTVNLTPKAWQAMKVTADRIGSTSTDVVNHALVLADAVTAVASLGLISVRVPDLLGDGRDFVLTVLPAKPLSREEIEAALRERIGEEGLAHLEWMRRIETARDGVVETAKLWLSAQRTSEGFREWAAASAAHVDAVDRLLAEERSDA